MMRQASPMQWLAVAQAVEMLMLGPPKPYSILTMPEAMLVIMYGMQNGLTRRGPDWMRAAQPSP